MVSQSHIRLEKEQNYHNQICLSCIAGCYGCRWKRYRRSKDPSSMREKIFAGVATLSLMCATVWLYYWIIADNDKYDFNRFIAVRTHSYFDWFSLFYALTIVAVVYTGSLVTFAVSHLVIGLQLHLHWIHKVLVIGNIAGCIVSSIMLGMMWPQGFSLMAVSFHITGPFLQISAVVMVTGIGWLVCSNFFRINNSAAKYSLMATFALLVLFIYLSPLLMYAPCVQSRTTHPKPKIIAHRGALQLAPENTQVSFETALNYNVSGFESDVSISIDGQLFLLHDYTFEMTTNIAAVFPDRAREPASNFTWEEIQSLDAGSWYLQRDPFRNARRLPQERKELYKQQKVMHLNDLLELAVRHNKSVVFDLRRPHEGSPYRDNYVNYTIQEILKHKNITRNQIWWLVGDPSGANYTRSITDKFLTTAEGRWDVGTLNRVHVTNVNAEYSEVSETDISEYNSSNITSIIYQVGKRWMFSLYWCEGAASVTSSACQEMVGIESPNSFVSPGGYLALWIAVDLISAAAIVAFFFLHRRHHYVYLNNPEAISLNSARHRYGQQTRRKSDKELLFGAKKRSSPQESEGGDSPVRTPQEMMNAGDATQEESLPANEVVGFQLQ